MEITPAHVQGGFACFQLVWPHLKEMGNKVIDERTVQKAMKEYARRFIERYGDVKILHMTEPVPLRDIYVPAQVISPKVVRSFNSVDELHSLFLRRGRRRLLPGEVAAERRDCLASANEHKYLNVLGAPGAGKSTFLRRLGMEALLPRIHWSDGILKAAAAGVPFGSDERSRYTHECLPVMIELRRFRTEDINLERLIREELGNCGLPESDGAARLLLKAGRLLILLDGVDEVPGDRLDKAITHIRDFVDRYSQNRFVISCRTAFYRSYFSRFTDVLLADFDDEQISGFVHNWFRSKEDRAQGMAEELLKTLDDPAHASAKELASTPLLLTFLCLTFDDRQRLPPNRSELYRQALEILMERWAASKRVHDEPVYRELHARLEVQMLADIATTAFKENRYFYTRRELIDTIVHFLHEELNAPKYLDGSQVLDAIEIQQGLIVQRAQDAYSFSHLTLQEYLTAVWYDTNQQVENLVGGYLWEVRWREVFILLAGIMSKADDLLMRMQAVSERALNGAVQDLLLLQWTATRATQPEDVREALAQRSLALVTARDLDRALSLVRGLDRGETDVRARAEAYYRDRDYDLDRVLDSDLDVTLNLAPERVAARVQVRERMLELVRAHGRAFDSPREVLTSHIGNIQDLLAALVAAGLVVESWRDADSALQALRERIRKEPPHTVVHEGWAQALNILAEALQLSPELCSSVDENALNSYLYACQLTLSCKDAATRVSRTTWDVVCDRMLHPPDRLLQGALQAASRRKPRPNAR